MGISSSKKLRVTYFTRKPRALGNFSVEIYFDKVRENLPKEIEYSTVQMPFESNGILKRVFNAFFCIFKQGDINHITGDIHYVATFLKRKKTILTVLDCGSLYNKTGIKYFLLKLIWFTIPIKKSIKVTAISEATKRDLIQLVNCNAQKIEVVYVCINEKFQKIIKDFNKSKPRILQIGTAENKNLGRLILSLNGITCKLVIIGKISEEIKLSLIENGIDYELIDWRLTDDEVINEYQKCDILSLASTLEGFGMPIVEANKTGRVVITGSTTSMPEIAGNAACIVNPFDVEDIRRGFLKIIADNNYREQLIENGFDNAKRFDQQNIANQYFDLYRKVATA